MKIYDKNENAIEVKNVSKRFVIPHDKSTTLKGAFINFFHKSGSEVFDALSDVSFEVKRGEFFGIIGRNGSGKSTLLKILAGIYVPNRGSIKINGRISPFLELGIGFNPELSGRDNIYLNGTVLGLTKKQIDEKFDGIVAFSELERFIDQKLKNYSSGMSVRLAFSVAIHANRDILLMDEVLAVGDENFRQKCLKKFEEYKAIGKTIIFVSHDISAVEKYCDRTMLIRNGQIQKIGETKEVVEEYIRQNRQDEIIDNISKYFKDRVGYDLDIYNPRSLNEFVQWQKLFYQNPLITECTDKYKVRDFISNTIGDKYNVPIIKVYDSVSEINFDEINKKSVFKVNWGSGQNLVFDNNLSCLDKSIIKDKLEEWLKPSSNHYYNFYEWGYKNIIPKIILEDFIKNDDDIEYQFFCFNGVPEFVLCEKGGKLSDKWSRIIYDLNWEKVEFRIGTLPEADELPKPKKFEEMKNVATKLSEPFPFVRVDMFFDNDNLYIRELTFYSGAGVSIFSPVEYDFFFGDKIKIPDKIYEKK